MKKLVLFLSILCTCYATTINAQALVVDSTRFITGTRCCTYFRYALPTADKGFLLIGQEAGHPGGIIPWVSVDTGGSYDVLVVKMDSSRQVSWIKAYGGSDVDQGFSACQTVDGGYAVLALTSSVDGDVTGFNGGHDYWLLKLDPAGNLLWQKTFGSIGGEEPYSIANTHDGGFILAGTTNHAGGDVPYHYGGDFTADWFVVKTDSGGNKQWARTVGGTGNELYPSILTVDSFYYLAGTSDSTTHDCYDTSWHPGQYSSSDYHLLKLDTGGHVLWDRSYGGLSADALKYALFDIRDSTIAMVGFSKSTDGMVTSNHGSYDIWVVKADKAGNLVWQKSLGGTTDDEGESICISKEGGYIVYGSVYPGTMASQNMWRFAIDSSGNEIFGKIWGGTGGELPTCIIPINFGYIAIGASPSTVFSEGDTRGALTGGFDGFVSYLDYWPLGINKIIKQSGIIKAYPNPAQNSLNISLQGLAEKGSLSIVNIEGKTIFNQLINNPSQTIHINTAEWVKGTHVIEWRSIEGILIDTELIILK